MGSASPVTTWLSRRLEFAPRDEEWETFYEKNKDHVPSLEGPVADVRQIMYNTKMRGQGKAAPIDVGLVVNDYDVHTAHGADIKLRTYLPDKSSKGDAPEGLPAMLYFHGGGFALGDLDGEDRTCRSLCVGRRIVVVGVDYRLAPENPYPAALDDSWDSLDWVSDHFTGGNRAMQNKCVLTHHPALTTRGRTQYQYKQDTRRRHKCRCEPGGCAGPERRSSRHHHSWPVVAHSRRLPEQDRAAHPRPAQHGRDARLANSEPRRHGAVPGLVQPTDRDGSHSVASIGIILHGSTACILPTLWARPAARRGPRICGCVGSSGRASTCECLWRCTACLLDLPRDYKDTSGCEGLADRCAVAIRVAI